MPEPRTIVVSPGTSGPAQTLSYTLAPNVLQYVESVVATVDTSGSGDVTPVLTITEQSGVVVADKEQGRAISGGAGGRATWARRLDDEGGGGGTDANDVLFNDPNNELATRYLDVPVNAAGPSGYQLNAEGQTVRLHADAAPFNSQFVLLDVDSSNTALTLSHDSANLVGYTHLFLTSDTGNFVLLAGNGDGVIRAFTAATAIRIRTHAGTDVIVALDEKIGFYAHTPAAQQTVTGSRGGNAALASLLTALAATGLIVDSTTV